jgi:hypothetical protein|tara:strand:- start:275 stop:556 length:282 start_codon:yes stop_codon:yes gene_type:complete
MCHTSLFGWQIDAHRIHQHTIVMCWWMRSAARGSGTHLRKLSYRRAPRSLALLTFIFFDFFVRGWYSVTLIPSGSVLANRIRGESMRRLFLKQ